MEFNNTTELWTTTAQCSSEQHRHSVPLNNTGTVVLWTALAQWSSEQHRHSVLLNRPQPTSSAEQVSTPGEVPTDAAFSSRSPHTDAAFSSRSPYTDADFGWTLFTHAVPCSAEQVTTHAVPCSAEQVTTEAVPCSAEQVTTEFVPCSAEQVTTDVVPCSTEQVTTEAVPCSAKHVTTDVVPCSAEQVVASVGDPELGAERVWVEAVVVVYVTNSRFDGGSTRRRFHEAQLASRREVQARTVERLPILKT